MASFGELLKEVRARSPYRDLKSFSQQVGISYEGMRKIEAGDRVPTSDTTEKIISVSQVPEEEAEELRRRRHLDFAEKHGINLYAEIPEYDYRRVAGISVEVIQEFLGSCEPPMELDSDTSEELQSEVLSAIREELSG